MCFVFTSNEGQTFKMDGQRDVHIIFTGLKFPFSGSRTPRRETLLFEKQKKQKSTVFVYRRFTNSLRDSHSESRHFKFDTPESGKSG